MRRVGLIEKGLPACRIRDDVLDQHFLKFIGAVALVLNLGAKAL
jgi:hypothetical protein